MKNFLILLGGIALGAGASWMYHKNKYEQMVQEEVESLREHAKKKETVEKVEEKIEEVVDDIVEEEEISEVEHLINDLKYTSDSEENITNKYKKPFVVTPDDFASVPGFDTDTFYYHRDDIISNDNQEMIEEEDIERILGMTTMQIKEQFGEYEEDAVYVRNMRLKCDYEILREEEDYKKRNGD